MVKPSASLNLEIPEQGTELDPAEARHPHGLAVLAVLLAATCWSLIGVAYRLILDEFDVSPLTLISFRTSTAALAMMIYVMLRPTLRGQIRGVRSRGQVIPLLGAGMLSITGFNIALIYTFEVAGVAVGTVLLYFAPSIVALGSWLAFKHRITRVQCIALGLSLCGVVGVSGVITGGETFQVAGIALGILAATGYASYSLVGQFLLTRYHPLVVVAMTQSVGALTAWTVKLVVDGTSIPGFTAIAWMVGVTGILTTLVPMVLYTWGLSKLGPPRASLLTTIEPVLAVGLAFIVLNETLTVYQLGGGTLVIGSVVLAASERVRR
ncbi:EamA family transporter [soil metagenome]